MKRFLLTAAAAGGRLWSILPFSLRRYLVFGLFVLESRAASPADSLRRLFQFADDLELTINERAMALGKGVHPKHELTRYHEFFTRHTPHGARVLDVGCGYGAVAATVAEQVPDCFVIGLDIDPANIAQAKQRYRRPNLEFRVGDIRDPLPIGKVDVVVLSNVLEHIDGRVPFLASLKERFSPRRILIRVPLFERDWKMALRRQLGVNYLSDPTHFIEHRFEELAGEIEGAGMLMDSCDKVWGEMWAVCRPKDA